MSDESKLNALLAGDYVLATKWSDGDPQDHWCVGFFKAMSGDRFDIVDDNGDLFRGNGFRRCKKISKRRGDFLLSKKSEIEACGKSLWWWLRQPLDS